MCSEKGGDEIKWLKKKRKKQKNQTDPEVSWKVHLNSKNLPNYWSTEIYWRKQLISTFYLCTFNIFTTVIKALLNVSNFTHLPLYWLQFTNYKNLQIIGSLKRSKISITLPPFNQLSPITASLLLKCECILSQIKVDSFA